jgi:hypothetical protein
MRFSSASAVVLTAGTLALAGCGGSGDDDTTTSTGSAASTTTGASSAVVTTTEAPAQQTTVVVPPASTATAPSTVTSGDGASGGTSGGTTPPTTTVTVQKPPTVDGDRPSITVRSDGTARTTAADEGQAQIWCDAARQGSYDDQLGDASTLVIAVQGSDAVTRCALPR